MQDWDWAASRRFKLAALSKALDRLLALLLRTKVAAFKEEQ
jgi:hypothetical protein